MFKENIEIIKTAYTEYRGTGMYLALFFLSTFYIIKNEKDKTKKMFLGYFPLVAFIIIMNPLFNKLINDFINVNVYFRLFWILPVGISIAYSAVNIVNSMEDTKKKIAMTGAIIILIILSGKYIYTPENYLLVDNWYKVPNEALQVVKIIANDELENKKVMLPETLVPYIRQIDSNIELAYPRQPYEYDSNDLLTNLNKGNVKYVTSKCKEKKCNYIIYNKATELNDNMLEYGYEVLGETPSYIIYKMIKD